LKTHRRFRPIEASAIRPQAEYCDPPWRVLPDFALERAATRSIFLIIELRCCGSRSPDERSHTVSVRKQLVLITWLEQAIGESCGEQGRPESISRPREVETCRARV
jgi:hypothetical protein